MKSFIAISLLLAVTLAYTELEYQTSFTAWTQKYHKSYHHDEFQFRYRIFRSNMDFIKSQNALNRTYTVAMNAFGDLNQKEFQTLMHGVNYTHAGSFPTPSEALSLPLSWNWNTKGAVTPIKNQGQCGSCWSFSTTGSVEGCHFQASGKLVSLSEQNLMDCSWNQGNQGCNGGLMTQAMTYIISNGGIDTEASYPYTAEDGTCTYTPANRGATQKSFINVQTGDENDLQAKVYTRPTSVAIDASHSSFQFYSSGVYDEPNCSTSQLDHGVLAVGWGVSQGVDYWLVKNSWGTDWGQSGFIWMSRNNGNQCGIATMATMPVC